jgi:hypothetical protein
VIFHTTKVHQMTKVLDAFLNNKEFSFLLYKIVCWWSIIDKHTNITLFKKSSITRQSSFKSILGKKPRYLVDRLSQYSCG